MGDSSHGADYTYFSAQRYLANLLPGTCEPVPALPPFLAHALTAVEMVIRSTASMEPPINLALVGCGIYAKENYATAIEANPLLRLVALYSRSWRSAADLKALLSSQTQAHIDLYGEDASGGMLAGNIEDLFAQPTVHAVIIALPIPKLYEIVHLALKSGKHVLSEKPLAANPRQGVELLRDYRRLQNLPGVSGSGKSIWYVAENWRMLEATRVALDFLHRRNRKRRVLGFRMRQSLLMRSDSPFLAQSSWRANTGLLLDGAIHGVAVLRQLLLFHPASARSLSHDHEAAPRYQPGASRGAVTDVAAFANHLQSHLPAPDTLDCIARVHAPDGRVITGTLQFSYGTTFPGPVWEIAYGDGVLCVNGFSHVTFVPAADGDDNAEQLDVHTSKGLEETAAAVVDAWVAAIVGEVEHMDVRLDPVEAGRDLQVLDSILQSAERNGTPVAIASSLMC